MKKKNLTKKEKEAKLNPKARNISIKEGLFATAKTSFGDHYVSPFAIAINASNSLVAFFSSVAGLLGPLSQIFGSCLMEKYSRKKIVVRAILIESLMWLPLVLTAILFYFNILTNILPLITLLFFALYIIIGNLASPSWFSWMGDIVDEKYRGRWFAKRNLLVGFVTIVLTIIAAFFLDFVQQTNYSILGFGVLFTLAFMARFKSHRLFKKQHEPELKLKKGYYFSFTSFILNSRKNNFGKFTIFRATLHFAASVSAPLIAIYLLRNLGFSYTIYMAIVLSGTFFNIILINLWGKIADKYGNYKVMSITGLMVPLIPIAWIFTESPIYFILVPSLIGGVAWSGFNLAAGNFIYDNLSQEKRGLAVSYYNMLNGIGIFLGAGLGALLIKYIPEGLFLKPILLIFLISGVLRFITIVLLLPTFKEIRKTQKFEASKAMKMLSFKQLGHTLHEETHDLLEIKKYLREK